MNRSCVDMDYQDTIRAAALAFLERHQGEHLADFAQLLFRTTNHMVETFQVDRPLAVRLTNQAINNLFDINVRQKIDLEATAEHTVVITDPVRGSTWSVPVHLIYEHLIAAGHGKLLTPAT